MGSNWGSREEYCGNGTMGTTHINGMVWFDCDTKCKKYRFSFLFNECDKYSSDEDVSSFWIKSEWYFHLQTGAAYTRV